MFITGRACCFRCTFCSSIALFVLRSLTAVGYGRLYPVTTPGKGVAMVTAIIGTFYLAMPLSIVGTKFYDIYELLDEMLRKRLKKMKKIVMVSRAFSTSSLRRRASQSQAKDDIMARYKDDIQHFCNFKSLSLIENVNPETIAEAEVWVVRNPVHFCLHLI